MNATIGAAVIHNVSKMRGTGPASSSPVLVAVLGAALLTLGGTLFWVLVAQPSSPSAELSARKARRMAEGLPPAADSSKPAEPVPASPGSTAPMPQTSVASAAVASPSLAAMVAGTPAGPGADAATADPVAKTAMIAAAAANACPSPPMTLEQKELLEKAFHGQQLKVELGFFGDPSTGALASQIAYVLALDSIDAKVYGGGTIDSPAEHGLELFIRNHLAPSKKDAAILKRFAEAKIPFTTSEMPKNEDRSVDLFVFVAPNGEHCRP